MIINNSNLFKQLAVNMMEHVTIHTDTGAAALTQPATLLDLDSDTPVQNLLTI